MGILYSSENFYVYPILFSTYKSAGGDWHYEDKYISISGAGIGARSVFNHWSIDANYIQLGLMGNITDELTLSKDLVSMVLRKELSIMGTWNSTYRPQKPNDWKESLKLIQNGVKPSELVTHWISLEELPDTLKKLNDHKRREKTYNSVKVMVNNWA